MQREQIIIGVMDVYCKLVLVCLPEPPLLQTVQQQLITSLSPKNLKLYRSN